LLVTDLFVRAQRTSTLRESPVHVKNTQRFEILAINQKGGTDWQFQAA